MSMRTAAARPVTAYLPQGQFGHAVVHRLARPQDVVLPVDHALADALVPYADRLVLVADADRVALREALDDLSFTRSLPSLGLELTPTELRCGPLVVPGRTACYHCYARRRQQHGYRPLPEDLEPLPQGYARHHVVLGAGLISLALGVLDREGPVDGGEPGPDDATGADGLGGQVWTVDLVTGMTSLARTIATDRCETCSGRYAARRDGVPALAALLPGRVI
jgi:hypothetical protein avisC_05777